ncbi:MAG: COX15/CtaA family protein [Haloarculaceae archaeon]
MDRRFRRLLGVTLATTFVLILLGLHTGDTSGGLSCGTHWPFCNGWLGLFPANWASFFEWFHRLVAMIDGFLLLGSLYGAWRWQDDRRVAYAVTAAIVLLPAQVTLGAMTTTAGGFFAGGFNPVVIATHFTTATLIFALIAYATARTFGAPRAGRLQRLGALGVVFVLAALVFAFVGPFASPPTNDAGYYAATYALLALLVGLLVWSETAVPRASLLAFRALAAAATLVLYADMLLSRRLFALAPIVGDVASAGAALLVAGVAVTLVRTAPEARTGGSSHAD